MGVLYTNLEDLITEDDCWYEEGATPEYAVTFFCFSPVLIVSIRLDHLQRSYIILMQVMLHERLTWLDVDDFKTCWNKSKLSIPHFLLRMLMAS